MGYRLRAGNTQGVGTGKHGIGNGQWDTESQEVAGTRIAVEDGQRGSGGRLDDG